MEDSQLRPSYVAYLAISSLGAPYCDSRKPLPHPGAPMSRPHLTPLTMLCVAALGTLASAQAPAPSPGPAVAPTDSVAPDSVKPKKTGRFGGLMNKAKSVAGNKNVQAAVKAAGSEVVKGAAMGVACTVVPGAAMVSAATGKGPCANGMMAGLMSGGGIGPMSGLSNTAATSTAMKMMKGSGAYGLSNIIAAAAAAKMMKDNGLSNAAATATMKDAGMSAADMAAAMKMMQSNNAQVAAAMSAFSASQPAPAAAPTLPDTASTAAPKKKKK